MIQCDGHIVLHDGQRHHWRVRNICALAHLGVHTGLANVHAQQLRAVPNPLAMTPYVWS